MTFQLIGTISPLEGLTVALLNGKKLITRKYIGIRNWWVRVCQPIQSFMFKSAQSSLSGETHLMITGLWL